MSEKYILMGRGMPSIIPNDQTTPGTRLTATEARQYARRLVELADELTPADPPPAAQPGEDARIAEIRTQLEALELIAAIKRERLTYPASSEERYCFKQLIIIGAEEVLTLTGFDATAAIRDLLARLDAVTQQRDRALRAGFAEYQDTPGIHTASFEEWCKRALKESTDG